MAKAPDFVLEGTDGKTHRLSDHKGKPVVVYFYPKDDTPGCTREACDFRDHLATLTQYGATVYGISKDTLNSHQKFYDKYGLNFVLLSDPDQAVHKAFGAIKEGKTIRSTYLIDTKGNIAKTWQPVTVDNHVNAVLKAIEEL